MTKTKAFLIVAILLALVSVFGAWTGSSSVETRYADAQILSTYASENVYYTRKEVVEEKYTPNNCPTYRNIEGLTNACGPVAGAQIIGYYDKYYTELIPNWSSFYTSGKYRPQDATYVPALIRELYSLMSTNVDGVGVTERNFLNGLTSYINAHGYQVGYQSVKSGKKLDYDQCKNAVDNNKVIALLVAPCKVYILSSNSGYDSLSEQSITGNHIMVAYGYYKVNYYNNSGLFRTDTYVCVSTGLSSVPVAYYRVDATTNEAAYIVNIQ